jgi:excisionase family DNA binding protein
MAAERLTFSTAEAAEVIGCSEDKVRELVHAGVLPRVPHMGRLILIRRDAVLELVGVPDRQELVSAGAVRVVDGVSFS